MSAPEPVYVWTNFELGFEHRSRRGFLFRVYAGVSIRINKPAEYCTSFSDTVSGPVSVRCEGPTRWLPVVGSAFGYAF